MVYVYMQHKSKKKRKSGDRIQFFRAGNYWKKGKGHPSSKKESHRFFNRHFVNI